jgi:hypothetical protein
MKNRGRYQPLAVLRFDLQIVLITYLLEVRTQAILTTLFHNVTPDRLVYIHNECRLSFEK